MVVPVDVTKNLKSIRDVPVWDGDVVTWSSFKAALTGCLMDKDAALADFYEKVESGELEEADREHADFNHYNQQLWSVLIRATKSDSMRHRTAEMHMRDGVTVWSKWTEYVNGEKSSKVDGMFSQFTSMRRDVAGRESIYDWIERLEYHSIQLSALGENISNRMMINKVKCIGDEDARIVAAGGMPDESYEAVRARLVAYGQELQQRTADQDGHQMAMSAAGAKMTCNYCKKTNHLEDTCYKKHGLPASQGGGGGRGGGGRGGRGGGKGGRGGKPSPT